MDPECRHRLISTTFHDVSCGTFSCVPCLMKEKQYHANTDREMSVHIQIEHQSLWHGTLFLPNALLPHIWLRLFEYWGQPDILKCKHCSDIFHHSDHSFMLNHLKGCHPTLLLALSLICE